MGASSSGCNGFFTVTLIISFIFATAWTGLAIIGFLLLNCSIDLSVRNKAYILKLIYFYNENCLPDWWDKASELTGVKFKTTSRTEAVLYWYAASGALRALTALGAMVAMAMCCFGKKSHAVATPRPSPLAWVWVAVSLAGLIGDLVCSVLYGLDIGNAQDLVQLTGIEWAIPPEYEDLLWAIKLCPIVMMLFCSRFCVFWIMDACLLIMVILSLARQQKEAKIYGSSPGDDLGPWRSKFTNAAGVDKGEKSNKNVGNNGNVGHPDRWLNNNQNMFARSVSEYYAEPLTNGGNQPGGGNQDTTNHGAYMSSPIVDPRSYQPGGGNQDTTDHGAYMSSPIVDPRSYPQTPSDIYTQPWSHERPPHPHNGGGHSPRVDAPGHSPRVNGPGPSPHLDPHWQPQLDQRGGPDPRSPWPHPAAEQAFFPNTGYGKPHPSPSQEQPMPSQGAHHRLSNGGAPAEKEPPRRYVEKLRDVEEERLALQEAREAREAERRRRDEERAEEERQHAKSVQQEMIAKAHAMEKSRRLRREAAGNGDADGETKKEKEGRMRGPPPPVPAKPRRPEELKNQTPWSYVGPALAHPKDLPMQNRAGRDDDDSDEDEEKPTVPVPDYTLHIKRPNDRPTIDTN